MQEDSILCLSWLDVREEVRKVNNVLFEIIEQISPNQKFPLYKIKYKHGEKIVSKGTFQLPSVTKNYSLPHNIQKDLNYCAIPLSLLLNKDSEIFTEIQSRIIPLQYLYPGQLFGLFEALSPYPYSIQDPKPIWSVAAGARSVFMLPKISDIVRHNRIKREFHVTTLSPKKLSDHWAIFSEIANHTVFKDRQWYSNILVFPYMWLKKQNNDIGWLKFRNYLLEIAWIEAQVLREKSTFGYLWESISSEAASSYKTKPYFIDTLQHLVFISMGARPGFRCIFQSESAAPTSIIEEVYDQVYDLGVYAPIIMGTNRLLSHQPPIYYSFNYPTLLHSAIEINKPRRTITGMREIKRLIDVMERKIKYNITAVTNVLKDIKYDFFHHENDPYGEISLSKHIVSLDPKISIALSYFKGKEFASAAHFFRGCVGISSNY